MSDQPKASRSLRQAEKRWLNRRVVVFVRNINSKTRSGPYPGVVKGISTNEVSAGDEAAEEFSETGLLVEIPELGRHTTYGEWPVRFGDAVLI